ncbi:MAG: hypothetical protein NDF53_00155 [archaeon GB-1867-097]|nr:hypothetical protein [Candidatus Culexmicrobium thermophilum]MCS7384145.1 hypothetical protein [Candidatus Culexmicrobium thermophilum]
MRRIPTKFINWIYVERAQFIREMRNKIRIKPEEIWLQFTKHTPTIISHGSAGLNGSIKGVGFILKRKYIERAVEDFIEHIRRGWRDGYSREGLELLIKHIYGDECIERIDFTKLATIELAKKHTYINLRENREATLLFYQPPITSYEVRVEAEIHENGLIHRYVNAVHDAYHKPSPEKWKDRPVYIFKIKEIYDNSSTKDGFGKRIY